jgi:carbon-monoxide dehydrogenase medium subunit
VAPAAARRHYAERAVKFKSADETCSASVSTPVGDCCGGGILDAAGEDTVKPPLFEYHAPETLPEALSLLGQYGPDAKVLAGGQSLLPLLNLRLARPANLIDINGLRELGQIQTNNGGLAIGAMVRQRAAERSDLIRERNPLLAEALPLIGHPQIRNRGTIGGSLAHADPASELPAVAAALDATLVVRGPRGERVLKPDQFFVSYLTTAMEADELLVEVRLPAWPSGAGWAMLEISRRHGDFAVVGVACMLRLNAAGAIAEARLAFTGAGEGPIRARDAEANLAGQPVAPDTFNAAADRAAAALDPVSDVHAPASYRLHVAKVLTRRALNLAASRARAEGGAA